MRREFEAFDSEIIRAEFRALPIEDESELAALMDDYRNAPIRPEPPIQVQSYVGGIRCLRHRSPHFAGRCLFFVAEASKDYQRLVIVVIYKKETDQVPPAILRKAIDRKETWLKKNK